MIGMLSALLLERFILLHSISFAQLISHATQQLDETVGNVAESTAAQDITI
jgi:hypothetical protein